MLFMCDKIHVIHKPITQCIMLSIPGGWSLSKMRLKIIEHPPSRHGNMHGAPCKMKRDIMALGHYGNMLLWHQVTMVTWLNDFLLLWQLPIMILCIRYVMIMYGKCHYGKDQSSGQ